jgi:hypothetical protein
MRAPFSIFGLCLLTVGVSLAVLLAPPAAPPAQAEGGFRCGTGRVIRNGETEDDVARKCGDPDAVRTWNETRTETTWQKGQVVERQVVIVHDEWTYNLGPDRLIRYLSFTDGRLCKVATGGYGE